MHKHVEWDDPGHDSVIEYYAKDPNEYARPYAGCILSARFQGKVVRIKVAAYVEDTSIGDVVALIDPSNGGRLNSLGKLSLGDTVRLPDEYRAFEPPKPEDDEDDD
ncbi:hypothetical protein [Aidingimonas halophila]|uniref:Uncharacterized protein n=1 Tax=Aidingimonas halophila TaxID=574349 RepID=A0A1H3FN13_9GAMM|nr:hypothetical protein [Aidingimonas halophila]GHC38187.1 hypothetical protein GCM10008094_34410 [Aidingimonas halophila]SDX92310.1 hypothetical protein SAMN05443545_10889 [Aidingimonas halophila]